MDTFTVRDLREHTGALIHDAEAGYFLSVTLINEVLKQAKEKA